METYVCEDEDMDNSLMGFYRNKITSHKLDMKKKASEVINPPPSLRENKENHIQNASVSSLEYSQTKGSEDRNLDFSVISTERDRRVVRCFENIGRTPLGEAVSSNCKNSQKGKNYFEETEIERVDNSKKNVMDFVNQYAEALKKQTKTLFHLNSSFEYLNKTSPHQSSSFPLKTYPIVSQDERERRNLIYIVDFVTSDLSHQGVYLNSDILLECVSNPSRPLLQSDIKRIFTSLFGESYKIDWREIRYKECNMLWMMNRIWDDRERLTLHNDSESRSHKHPEESPIEEIEEKKEKVVCDVVEVLLATEVGNSSIDNNGTESDDNYCLIVDSEVNGEAKTLEEEQIKILMKNLKQIMDSNIRHKLMDKSIEGVDQEELVGEECVEETENKDIISAEKQNKALIMQHNSKRVVDIRSEMEVFDYFMSLPNKKPEVSNPVPVDPISRKNIK